MSLFIEFQVYNGVNDVIPFAEALACCVTALSDFWEKSQVSIYSKAVIQRAMRVMWQQIAWHWFGFSQPEASENEAERELSQLRSLSEFCLCTLPVIYRHGLMRLFLAACWLEMNINELGSAHEMLTNIMHHHACCICQGMQSFRTSRFLWEENMQCHES